MADEPRPMSQEEIDALFASMDAEMSGETGEQTVPSEDAESAGDAASSAPQESEAAAERPSEAPVGPSAADSGTLDQGAIDALLQQVATEPDSTNKTSPEPAAEAASTPVPVGAPVSESPSDGDEQAAAGADKGPLDQGDIDALLAQMQGDVAPSGNEGPPAEVAESVAAQEKPASGSVAATADDAGERTLDQAEIDAMMAAASAPGPTNDSDESDALDGGEDPAASISQEDIDRMLADLAGGGGDAQPEQDEAPIELPAGVPSTEQITADSLQSLIQKHAGGTSRVESSSMINQDDIQLLVDQLTQASGEMPNKDEIDAMLNDRGQDVDALLDRAGDRISLTDAVQPSMVGMTVPSDDMRSGGRVLSPEEWRGTRYLLVAGVLLLGMCSLALVLVVSSVNRLTSEIRVGRDAQAVPLSDDFEDDLRYVDSLLSSASSDQVDAGVRHGERLKRRYVNNFTHLDRISWRLAEHHRAQGAHMRAFQELRAMRERSGSLMDDPRFYVAYADSLMHIGRMNEAKQALYDLLANEGYYLNNDEGRHRDADQLRNNRSAVRRAFLLLGQLYLAAADPDLNVEGGLL